MRIFTGMDPDEELVRRAQKGDRFAFERLVEQHDWLYRLAARVLGSREDAADASRRPSCGRGSPSRSSAATPAFRPGSTGSWSTPRTTCGPSGARCRPTSSGARRPARPLRRARLSGELARARRARRELPRRRRPLRRARPARTRDRRDDRGRGGYGEVEDLPRAQRARRAPGNRSAGNGVEPVMAEKHPDNSSCSPTSRRSWSRCPARSCRASGTCRSCAEQLRRLEAGRTALRAAPAPQALDERRARMLAALPERREPWSFKGHLKRVLVIAAPVAAAQHDPDVVVVNGPYGGDDAGDAGGGRGGCEANSRWGKPRRSRPERAKKAAAPTQQSRPARSSAASRGLRARSSTCSPPSIGRGQPGQLQ